MLSDLKNINLFNKMILNKFIKKKKVDQITKSVELYHKGKQETNHNRKNNLFLKSFETCNYNLDGLFEVINYYRMNGKYKQGYDLGMEYVTKYGYKNIKVFENSVNKNIYKYKFLDEMYLCAYYIGNYSKAYDFITYIISSEHNDKKGRESELSRNFTRMGTNLQYVLSKVSTNKIPNKIEKLENLLENKSLSIGVGIPCIPRDFNILHNLLDSISQQTKKPIEVVISLSNISENDRLIFKNILAKYKINFRTFISKNKQNASENRNIILDYFHSQTKFEILSFIDSDDEMHSQRLEIISKSFGKYSCDVLLHGYYTKKEPILSKWFRIRNNIETQELLQKEKSIISLSDGRLHYGHVSISKKVKIKFKDFLNISEDYNFIYDNYFQNNKIYHLQLPISKYSQSQNNLLKIKEMSFCFTLYNRMKMMDGKNILTLFPKCLKSLLKVKKNDEFFEICVSDFYSNDVQDVKIKLEKILSEYKNVGLKYIKIKDKFSRGIGLNKSFDISTKEYIFFIDVDMLFLDRTVIDNAIQYLKLGYVYFPICSSFKTIHHSEYFCQNYGYGNMVISKKNFLKKQNGWMKKYTWGEEDNDMYTFFKQSSQRNYIESFCHQWHPNPKKVSESRRMTGKKIKNKLKNYICIQPTGGLCNYLRVIFSYYRKAKKENKKLIVIWNITDLCNGYFLDYFQPINDILFDSNNINYSIDYTGFSIHADFHPDYTSLKLLPYMSNIIEEKKNTLKSDYISVHIRRTDHINLAKQYKEYTSNTDFYEFINLFQDKSLYIATDNINTYKNFRKKYAKRILFNYHDTINNSFRQTSLKNAIVDLYMCVNANKFMGSGFSSFSDLINILRENKYF